MFQPKAHSGNRKRQEQYGHHQSFCARFSWRFTALKCREIPMHFRGRSVTFPRIVRARAHEHVVELQQTFTVRPLAKLRVNLWEIEPVFSGASFVKKFA
jgi:hypothetical protein